MPNAQAFLTRNTHHAPLSPMVPSPPIALATRGSALALAQANLVKAKQDVDRLTPLVKADAASQQDLDAAAAALNSVADRRPSSGPSAPHRHATAPIVAPAYRIGAAASMPNVDRSGIMTSPLSTARWAVCAWSDPSETSGTAA